MFAAVGQYIAGVIKILRYERFFADKLTFSPLPAQATTVVIAPINGKIRGLCAYILQGSLCNVAVSCQDCAFYMGAQNFAQGRRNVCCV